MTAGATPGSGPLQREVDALVVRVFFTIAVAGTGVVALIVAGQ